jgi:DHA3 family macrolide efflux protein-like MFS transporter
MATEEARPLRTFLIIWSGQALSLLGSQLVQFALVWWLTRTTGSATILALASLAAILPQILLGPWAGALVDRWPRRTVMLVADTGIALATMALAVLFWLNRAGVGSIYALLLLRACGGAFHWPAMQASTTLMVPRAHLARVGGLNQILSGAANIIIPPLGALAMEVLPMQGILAIDVVTALPAILSLLVIAIPQPLRQEAGGKRATVWADMQEGWRMVWGWKALLMLAGVGIMINLLGRAAGTLTPLLVMKDFGGGALQLGMWQAAAGVGTIAGGTVLSLWGGFRRRVVTQMLALILDGMVIVVIAVLPRDAFPLAVALILSVGFLEAIIFGMGGALFQMLVPPQMQGRVFAWLLSVTQLLTPLGLLLAGPVADAWGVRTWWVMTGIMLVVMGASALLLPPVVHIEERGQPA